VRRRKRFGSLPAGLCGGGLCARIARRTLISDWRFEMSGRVLKIRGIRSLGIGRHKPPPGRTPGEATKAVRRRERFGSLPAGLCGGGLCARIARRTLTSDWRFEMSGQVLKIRGIRSLGIGRHKPPPGRTPGEATKAHHGLGGGAGLPERPHPMASAESGSTPNGVENQSGGVWAAEAPSIGGSHQKLT
jgi:hypothetical protein